MMIWKLGFSMSPAMSDSMIEFPGYIFRSDRNKSKGDAIIIYTEDCLNITQSMDQFTCTEAIEYLTSKLYIALVNVKENILWQFISL